VARPACTGRQGQRWISLLVDSSALPLRCILWSLETDRWIAVVGLTGPKHKQWSTVGTRSGWGASCKT
jgi:hypothetical protein